MNNIKSQLLQRHLIRSLDNLQRDSQEVMWQTGTPQHLKLVLFRQRQPLVILGVLIRESTLGTMCLKSADMLTACRDIVERGAKQGVEPWRLF